MTTNDARRKMKSMRGTLLALACCALFALAATDAHAQAGETVDELLTKGGPLNIVRTGEATELAMELRLGGKKLADLEAMYASFVAYFRDLTTDGELIVLSVSEGGSGCPAQFRIVRIEGGRASVTDEFGDCSDAPAITFEQLRATQLILRFPGYYRLAQESEPGFRKPPPTTWVYSKGVLKEQKAAPAPAPRRRGK